MIWLQIIKICIFLASILQRHIREINESSKEVNNFTQHALEDDEKPTNFGAQSLPVVAPAETKIRSK